MIRPREHLQFVKRDKQSFDSNLNTLHLDMNEYIPYASKLLYDEWINRVTPELMSAYPRTSEAYNKISKLIYQPEEKIVLTNGSDGVIYNTLLAFCDPGDLIGYVIPTYTMYSIYADILNLRTRCVEYDTNGELDKNEILRNITPDMRVFILANPNGIFGNDIEPEFLLKIIEKGNLTGTIILIDEVYAAFIDKGISRFAKYTDVFDNLIIARSFSKSYGLAGARVGYSISNRITRKYLISVRSNVEINALAVEAIKVWCSHPDLLIDSIEKILYSKEVFCNEMHSLGVFVIKGYGNFVLIKIPSDLCDDFRKILEKHEIYVKYLEWKNEKWIRITVGTEEIMRVFTNLLKKVLANRF